MLFDLREVGLVHNYHKNYTQKKKYLTPFFPKKNYKLMDTRPKKCTQWTRALA